MGKSQTIFRLLFAPPFIKSIAKPLLYCRISHNQGIFAKLREFSHLKFQEFLPKFHPNSLSLNKKDSFYVTAKFCVIKACNPTVYAVQNCLNYILTCLSESDTEQLLQIKYFANTAFSSKNKWEHNCSSVFVFFS